jgi:hypothetical protein
MLMARQISSWVTDFAPCRNECRWARSPPPITTSARRLQNRRRRRLAGDAAVLLRQEIHREVDAVEVAPGRGGRAANHGAAVNATASYW